MNKITLFIIAALFLAGSQSAVILPAFPNAEGFGANTIGGRGGTVYIVTNTNDAGAGTLRQCVEAIGARTCVFETGGLITLQSPLVISNPYITIAGQTATGGGITLKSLNGDEIFVTQTHDVIIRYITVRAGAGGENHTNQIAKNGTELYNIIIDHNSLSWGVDSNIETWYRVNGATVSWSIISEGLNCSTHSKGCHSKGVMIGGYKGSEAGGVGSENISLLNNLMAHNVDRNPLMQLCGIAQVVNNVTYNPGTTFSHQQLNCTAGASYVNWINNYHKKGAQGSYTDLKIIPADSGTCGQGKAFISGNYGNGTSGAWSQSMSGSCAGRTDIITTIPASAPIVTTVSAQLAYNNVLAMAGNSQAIDCNGAWYSRRDAIDARIVNDVKNGTGNIIDDPSEVGGWITPAFGVACGDTDRDGIPNSYELSHGLDPNNNADGKSIAPDGYTWLEDYFNGTGGIVVPATFTPTSTLTMTPTPTQTATATTTPTGAPTRYPTFTPIRTPVQFDVCDLNKDGRVTWWELRRCSVVK